MIRAAALLAALALAGCRTCPTCAKPPTVPPLQTVRVVTERVACAVKPPPVAKPYAVAGPAGGCPTPWANCILRDDAAALNAYLEALESWAERTWERCGDKPTPTTTEAP